MSGLQARQIMESAVRSELFGPAAGEPARGRSLDLQSGTPTFGSWPDTHGLWHDAASGEEILTETEPLRRYGVGVLFPRPTSAAGTMTETTVGTAGLPADDESRDADPVDAPSPSSQPDSDSDDFDLSDANSFQPSAMAVSFRVRLSEGQHLAIEATCASYEPFTVSIGTSKREWWVRRPLVLSARVDAKTVLAGRRRVQEVKAEIAGHDRVRPQLQAYSRPVPGDDDPACRLVTIVLVNATPGTGAGAALLQSSFQVTPQAGARVESYPDTDDIETDAEDASIALLYRNKRTYAIGHGCAADWDEPVDGAAPSIRADPLPAYEVPSLTPDVFATGPSGERERVQVSMAALANGDPAGDEQLDKVLTLYSAWIADRRDEIPHLPLRYVDAAERHMDLCDAALGRMLAGRRLLNEDGQAARAFRLANQAMLYQQVRSRLKVRPVSFDKEGLVRLNGPHPHARPEPGVGYWRPFQIAFLLASLPDTYSPDGADRELVDLIFFPTGGGKTEAYLGAAAISIFARRLRDPRDGGTDVLMRYTLRLLTAQQFLRAAALLCVMEDMRTSNTDLGEHRFSIGIWLGGATTPNTWTAAKTALARLRRDAREENPFLLLRCPWCGAQMGPVPRGKGQEAVGYMPVGSRVRFVCPDRQCRFANPREGLPVHVVDEEIYETRPTLVIGTVDKFAMLAWQTQARSLFGIAASGERDASPPGVIIQDELHLISGPLGSMVGLYEAVVEDLCTDRRSGRARRPKIIASTATIRRYEQQVHALYGRPRTALFPPHGLEEGRSFFAEPAAAPDGTLAPGRRYLGIMSPSLGSIQTVQVRVAAATLQGAMGIEREDRDGYWTNLNFLNSLRELGNTVSLLQSDIPDYLTGVRKREGMAPGEVRWPRVTLELTSRRRSDEIPRAIDQLQQEYGSESCVDVCLASNIIEVGVDIDRLGLMTIVGQPKTTAQYIQVSGRVGRRWSDRPGLVITLYGAAKPRDRSHYERFRSYHQRLYSQVEPTSLTPFALPALLRGLHGATVAHIRQSSDSRLGPDPFPALQFAHAAALLRDRLQRIDPAELEAFDAVIARREREWRHGERTEWSANSLGGDPMQGLMRYAGSSQEPGARVPTIWETLTSMRTVDAECRLRITDAYAIDAASQEDGPA